MRRVFHNPVRSGHRQPLSSLGWGGGAELASRTRPDKGKWEKFRVFLAGQGSWETDPSPAP